MGKYTPFKNLKSNDLSTYVKHSKVSGTFEPKQLLGGKWGEHQRKTRLRPHLTGKGALALGANLLASAAIYGSIGYMAYKGLTKNENKKGKWVTLRGGRRIFIPEGSGKDFIKKELSKRN